MKIYFFYFIEKFSTYKKYYNFIKYTAIELTDDDIYNKKISDEKVSKMTDQEIIDYKLPKPIDVMGQIIWSFDNYVVMTEDLFIQFIDDLEKTSWYDKN